MTSKEQFPDDQDIVLEAISVDKVRMGAPIC